MSEIVDGLEKKGLLERMRDAKDKRRVLVWLTDDGQEALARDHEVLSKELLAKAMKRMRPSDREALLGGMKALIEACDHEKETS